LNISIYYLSIGSGHQAAAKALAEAFRAKLPRVGVRVVDPFANSIEVLPAILEKLQAASIVLTPNLYDNLWRKGTALSLYDWFTDLNILDDLLASEMAKHPADVVVATHVLPFLLIQKLRQRQELPLLNYGVMTDFAAHPYWPIEDIDGYFVGHDEVRNMLMYRGCDPEKIYATGIPISLDYSRKVMPPMEPGARKLRTLLIIGGVRSGAYVGSKQYAFDLINLLAENQVRDLELTLITGNQRSAKNEMDKYAQSVPFALNVCGFVNNMPTIMAENDILITKPGGLIVSEALASGICMLTMKGGPGQESANAEFLARHGVAFRAEAPAEALEVLQRCIANPQLVSERRATAKKLGRPHAAINAAAKVVELYGQRA